MMLAESPVVADSRDVPDRPTQQTTLYDLIATMSDVAPDADELITAAVMDMFHSHRIRFLASPTHLEAMIADAEAA